MDQPKAGLGALPELPSGWKNTSNLYLAPAVLCAIAFFQIFRCYAIHQTPWKGGGFGMFATTDSPGNRFVRVKLLTEKGEFAVPPPGHLKALTMLLQTAPSESNLAAMGDRLMAETWVPYDFAHGAVKGKDATPASSDSEADESGKSLPPASPPASAPDATAAVSAGDAPASHAPAKSSKPAFRTRGKGEPEPAADERAQLKSVRVEVWRRQWDTQTCRVSTRLLTSIERTSKGAAQ